MTPDQLRSILSRTQQVGDLGEDFVLRYELRRLSGHPTAHRIDLIGRRDVAMGYDVLSYQGVTSATLDRFIEVKTYSGSPHFFLSAGEEAAARKYGNRYCLYLVDLARIHEPGYEPLILVDPLHALDDARWQETVQTREYHYLPDLPHLPADFAASTVLVGCYNSNEHQQWIHSHHCYNVRQGAINGSIHGDAVTTAAVRYLLLYYVQTPGTYRLFSLGETRSVSRDDMLRWGYPQPHALQYILYHITGELAAPPLDIKTLLRTYNDKLHRTSGTPIYLLGSEVQRYLLDAPTQPGTTQFRVFSAAGRPWTEVQSAQLRVLYLTGTTIAELAHRMHRPADEITAQLRHLGLLPPE